MTNMGSGQWAISFIRNIDESSGLPRFARFRAWSPGPLQPTRPPSRWFGKIRQRRRPSLTENNRDMVFAVRFNVDDTGSASRNITRARKQRCCCLAAVRAGRTEPNAMRSKGVWMCVSVLLLAGATVVQGMWGSGSRAASLALWSRIQAGIVAVYRLPVHPAPLHELQQAPSGP